MVGFVCLFSVKQLIQLPFPWFFLFVNTIWTTWPQKRPKVNSHANSSGFIEANTFTSFIVLYIPCTFLGYTEICLRQKIAGLRWIKLKYQKIKSFLLNLLIIFLLQVRLSLKARSQCPKRQQINLLPLKKRRHPPRPPKRPKRFKRRSWREPMALVLKRFAQQCISEGHWPSGQPGILNSPGNQLQLAIVWVSEFIWVTTDLQIKQSGLDQFSLVSLFWVTQTCKFTSSGLDQNLTVVKPGKVFWT